MEPKRLHKAKSCALPGCNVPVPPIGSGRPSDYCSNAHRQAGHRFVRRYLLRIGLLVLLDEVRRAVSAWQSLRVTYSVDKWREFESAIDAIAAHPIMRSRKGGIA